MPTDPIWVDWLPAARLPDASFLFLGADPCHTPAHEAQRPESCAHCGGEFLDHRGHPVPKRGRRDPIKLYETVVAVCVCGRTKWQPKIDRLPNRLFAPNPEVIGNDEPAADKRDRDSRTLEAVTGKAARQGSVVYEPHLEGVDRLKGGLGGHRTGSGKRKPKRPRLKTGRR